MAHQPYPNRRRTLRQIARRHRAVPQSWPTRDGSCVTVHVYDGLVSEGIAAELRRMLLREQRRPLAAR